MSTSTSVSFPASAVLPVAILGAGPVGLAAAAHLIERGIEFVLLEAGAAVGSALRQWAHVQLFSPWGFNVDPAAERLLRARGWTPPPAGTYPTGGDVVAHYLEPLSRLPEIAGRLRTQARVVGVARVGRDKLKADAAHAQAPFRIRIETPAGDDELLARAVIDTTGTWQTPNPLGSDGLPARGERALQAVIRYGIPDVLGRERARYAGRRVLVAGSGHSAFNVLVDLVKLAEQEPATAITWVVRRAQMDTGFGGGERDQLAARGALGAAVRRLVDAGRLQVALAFQADAVERQSDGVVVKSGDRSVGPVDEIIVATGFRPDFSFLREVQLGLDPVVESTPALAPLIDPNLHSCGTVRPHGYVELSHPEAGFYIAGMKSYGRAPTFLMRTGYEQVRSIVAAIAGDVEAAGRVELVLPETGVCSRRPEVAAVDADCCGAGAGTSANGGDVSGCSSGCAEEMEHPSTGTTATAVGCCGGPARADASACCQRDEMAKRAGASGCGCDGEGASDAARALVGAGEGGR